MKRYSFKDWMPTVNGVEITGFAPGDDVITAKRRNDSASDAVGAGGEMMVSISADKSGEISFKLLQTSSSNKYLWGLTELQESVKGFVPIIVGMRDTYRNDVATGLQGYIKKMPDMVRGQKGGTQEWVIVVERLDLLFGDVK